MVAEVLRNFARVERKIRARVGAVVRRAVVTNFSQNGFLTAQTSTLKDESRDGVEVFEQFGFTSQPPSGSEGVVVSPGGDTSQSIALNVGNRNIRVQTLQSGEAAVYNEAGATVRLLSNGDIVLTPGTGGVVRLGGDSAALAVARETDPVQIPNLQILHAAISAWVPVATDGGLALKTALAAWIANDPNDGFIESGGQGSVST